MSTAVIPGDGTFVELARKKSGTVFEKHTLSTGTLIHPQSGKAIPITPEFLDTIVQNFNRGVCPSVTVPLANDKNQHVEDPTRNTGEVIALRREGDKLIATCDVRNPQVAEGIRNGTILGSSAFLHMNYTDTRTGTKVGPTMLHNCLTNRPYVVDLEPFQEVAATAGLDDDVVLLSYSTDTGGPVMFATDSDSDSFTLTQEDVTAAAVQLSSMEDAWLGDEAARLSVLAMQVARGGPIFEIDSGQPEIPAELARGRVALSNVLDNLGWGAEELPYDPEDVDGEVARLTAAYSPDGKGKAAVDDCLELAASEHRDAPGAHQAHNGAFGLANLNKFGPSRRGQTHKADHEHDCDALGCEDSNVGGNASVDHDAEVARIMAHARELKLMNDAGNRKGRRR